MSRRLLIILIPFLLLALTGCAAGGSTTQGDDPLTGMVEAKEVDINTKIPGRVIQIKVKEGEEVKAGQLLALIDSKDLKAKEEQLKAQVQAAQAQIGQARVSQQLQDLSSSSNVNLAQAKLIEAQSQAALAQKSYERMKTLYTEGAVSAQQLDEIAAKVDAAGAAVLQAQAGVSAAQAARLQVQMGQENVQAAQAQYEQALAALKEVQNNLAETQIKAPCSGTATSLLTEEGELVSTGMPLITLTDYSENWVNLKVPETKLKKLTQHQKLDVTTEIFPGKIFTGEIVDISKKPTFATSRATNDRGEKDIITYNVKIRLNSPELRPGSTAAVKLPSI